ncbi:hypothetical protein D4764_02G0000290 [Takifugu flavidus]|uniref:Uncharacterized protein n=1 Tax=Takifugu flavidus TaxID=433684 RepID=A0A5C6NJR0_9TELE|nr:hypothetical protein D4764_02G0000290 [Takifugu flavidus]
MSLMIRYWNKVQWSSEDALREKVVPFLRAHGDEVALLYLLCALFGISSVARSSDQVQCRLGLYLYEEYRGLSGNRLTKAAALPFLTAATPDQDTARQGLLATNHKARRLISATGATQLASTELLTSPLKEVTSSSNFYQLGIPTRITN